MKHRLTELVLLLIITFLNVSMAYCAPVKIMGLQFDNSDKMILINSAGDFSPKVPLVQNAGIIKKGMLQNPDRAYFDIADAILMTPSKTWQIQNSVLEEAAISQFSKEPNVVRIVLKYKKDKLKNADTAFKVYQNYNQAIITYSDRLVENDNFYPIYNPTKEEVYAPLKSLFKEKTSVPLPPATPQTNAISLDKMFEQNAQKNLTEQNQKMLVAQSYIQSYIKTQNGVLVKAVGDLSIKPSYTLESPVRMVIDIPNSTLKQELRSTTLALGALVGPDGKTLAQRDIFRIAQFDKSTVRIVIQGNNAKDYRAVIAPDRQNMFIAKRQDVINSKLTQYLADVIKYSTSKGTNADILSVEFDSPVSLSIFEENKIFYMDIQNVSDVNQASFDTILQNPYFKDAKLIKIALDKIRVQVPLPDNTVPTVGIAQNGKKVIVYFRYVEPENVAKVKEEKMKEEIKKVVEKQNRPMFLTSYNKVVIDAGHGGADIGATRAFIEEKSLNLDIAKLVAKNLEKEKMKVEMTRDNDRTLTLEERVALSEENSPDIFVSIHHNASLKEGIYGIETHWWREESIDLAKAIHSQLTTANNLQKWQTVDRGLIKSQFYVINHTTCPAVLIEVGFISNIDERNRLLDKKRQEEVAKAISDGIVDYFEDRGKKK